MMIKNKVIFGPPGTGKTTYLLNIVDKKLKEGIKPNCIGYFAYTKKAANEAIERACFKFNLERKEFKYFRTLHSLAFQTLGLSTNDVMRTKNYTELSEMLGLKLSNTQNSTDDMGASVQDDIYLKIIDLARVGKIELYDAYRNWGHVSGGWLKLDQINRTIEDYKDKRNLFDYTDMIIKFNDQDIIPSLEVVIVDEAQDLSPLQWDMVKKLVKNAKQSFVAGDDDQAIFNWAGASVYLVEDVLRQEGLFYEKFNRPSVTEKMIYAINSWKKISRNETIIGNSVRIMYDYIGTANKNLSSGIRKGFKKLSGIDEKENYTYKNLEENFGLLTSKKYKWHEALTKIPQSQRLYIMAAERRNQNMNTLPKIKLSTIHGAKGGESDHVVILTDLSHKAEEAYHKNPDDERRVFYVGMTRAKKSLHIVRSQSEREFKEIFA
jgi:superfamily I DNA/RNA helicase